MGPALQVHGIPWGTKSEIMEEKQKKGIRSTEHWMNRQLQMV